jgi:hypothetical protein
VGWKIETGSFRGELMGRNTKRALIAIATQALLLTATQSLSAQSVQADRILEPIDSTFVVQLQGNVRPVFRPENDLGPVDESLRLENITLMFKLTASQQADLTALLDELENPLSPNFHQWLTPEEFADQFGLSQGDIEKVVAWLRAQGFEITQTARSRNSVLFSGTAAQVRAAFGTEIHQYLVKGNLYYSNATEPSVPGALADVVLGIRALDNYPLRPRAIVRKVTEPAPDFTSGVTANTFVAPNDFAVIYDLNALYSAGIDGKGQSIAVVGQTDLYSGGSDIAAFRSASGLSANAPQIILIPGATDPGVVSGDINEASLDVEWSGAIARSATIIFVNGGSNGVFNALQYAVNNNTAPVISISYGACEADWGATSLSSLAQLAQQANAQGQTLVAAAGDLGPTDCDVPSTPGGMVSVATKGLAVDAPASLPYVTGMGGSEFNEGAGNYWKPTTNGADLYPSALSYIPEKVWNDTSSTNGLAAGGGGASADFAKPTWQAGAGVPDDKARDVPDLSLNASPMHDSTLACFQGSCVNGFRSTDHTLSAVGGTSVAAPAFAGIVALINQRMNTPKGQGNINPTLYSMAAALPAAFHDITTGNNMVPCEAGSPDCPTTGPMEIGYSAGAGYDLASGLGSIDAFNLVSAWGVPGTGNLPAPALTAPANGATGAALSPAFTWTPVAGSAGYRILIATNPADLPTHSGTIACSACTVVATPSKNSYALSSALTAGIYYWQVQAIVPASSAGTAAWSNIFGFTTTSATLAAPTLKVPANGATAVSLPPTFTWTAVSGSSGYRILITPTKTALPTNPSVSVCGGCTVGATTTAASYTTSTTSATSLTGGTTYYWQVQALPPAGSSSNASWSSVSSFTTAAADFSLSVSPGSVTLSPGTSTTSTLTLTPINNLSPSSVSFTCTASSTLAGVFCVVGALGSDNTATVTVTAASSASAFRVMRKTRPFTGGRVAVFPTAIMVVCLLLMGRIVSRRHESQPRMSRPCANLIVLLVALGWLLTETLSCGGGSGNGSDQAPPSPESGTITVQGTASTTSHAVSISVSVS